MTIEQTIPLLENILDHWKLELGKDYPGYKNHVYRIVHYCAALNRNQNEQDSQKIVIAACFHDLGIWVNDTIDYLPPSIMLAIDYLRQNELEQWVTEIELMIDMHHKLGKYQDKTLPLVEIFRQADLVDVSLGWVKFGLPTAYIASVKAQFPDQGFHLRLAQLAGQWFSRHPLRLPPFIKC